MRLSIIAAMADNSVIGRANALPWYLSADLKRFKALTMGHQLLMGRRTFESIGRPLPGRTTVVITRGNFSAEGVAIARSIEEAIAHAPNDEVFIAGGADIYAQTIHRANRMYITRVHAEVEGGDAFFPEFDDVAEWKLIDAEHLEADEKNEYPYSFLTYDRVGPSAVPENPNEPAG
jgi:dihydrofolate reductase